MKFAFILQDIQEISLYAGRAFISTFHCTLEESEKSDLSEKSDFSDIDSDSDSDLPDFDPKTFGCGEITSEVESMVENNWEICDPLQNIYGDTAADIIKETVKTAKEETQCAGLNFFEAITPGENRDLITTCVAVSYWCCCETVKKVSPILAKATTNLFY